MKEIVIQKHIDNFVEERFPKVLNKISDYHYKTFEFLGKHYSKWKQTDPDIKKLIIATSLATMSIFYLKGGCTEEMEEENIELHSQTTNYDNFSLVSKTN